VSGEVVNLRTPGTSTANPREGTLVAQATLPEGRSSDETPVLAASGRVFVLAQGTFAYGGSVTAEYVEAVPVEVTLTIEGA
jgi:hypothetical protein